MYTSQATPNRTRHAALTFVASCILWLLLTGSLAPAELVVGLVVASLATAFAAERAPILGDVRLNGAAALSFLRYLASFLRALVLANIDMARRVLSPRLPLRPEVIGIRTRLQSDIGRLALANSITLTPGTLSVDVDGEQLLIHWIDCPPGQDMQALSEAVAGQFERHLEGFLK